MENPVIKQYSIKKYESGQVSEVEDAVAMEAPITIVVNGTEFGTMLCTPTDLKELVTGFLASEGLIREFGEVDSLSVDEGKGFAYVKLKKDVVVEQGDVSRRVIGSCCGKSRQFYFQSDVKTAKTIMNGAHVTVRECIKLMKLMQEGSTDFQQTGGIHNAALCGDGEIVVSRSDIGRHNALDKVYGYCLMNGVPMGDKVIAFSGRISSEVLLKVSKMGVGVILSKSAPTTLGIELAEDLGITVVGFIRGERLNVYSRGDRVKE